MLGFTLIELMTVLAIIMILAGLIVGGAKYALSLLGRIQNEIRLPLLPIGATTEATIRRAMVHAGLLFA